MLGEKNRTGQRSNKSVHEYETMAYMRSKTVAYADIFRICAHKKWAIAHMRPHIRKVKGQEELRLMHREFD